MMITKLNALNAKKQTRTLGIVATATALGFTYSAFAKDDDKAAKAQKELPTKKASAVPDTVANPQVGEVLVKCAGIVKKGKNHCGANGHECNGLSAKDDKIKDFDPNEWIYVRKAVCDATPGKVVGQVKVVK